MRGGLERLTLGRTAPVVTRLRDRQRRRAGDIAQQGRGGGDQLDEGLVVLIELRDFQNEACTPAGRERCAQLVVAGWFAEPIDRPGIAHVLDEEGVATLGRAQVLDRVARDPPLHPDRQRLDDPHDNRARLAVRSGVVIGAEVLRGANRNPLGIPLIEADLAGIGVVRLRDATGLACDAANLATAVAGAPSPSIRTRTVWPVMPTPPPSGSTRMSSTVHVSPAREAPHPPRRQ